MDSVIWEFIKQVPALAVLAWVVHVFLKNSRSAHHEGMEGLRHLTDKIEATDKRALEVIDRNTEMLGQVKGLLERMNGAVDHEAIRD